MRLYQTSDLHESRNAHMLDCYLPIFQVTALSHLPILTTYVCTLALSVCFSHDTRSLDILCKNWFSTTMPNYFRRHIPHYREKIRKSFIPCGAKLDEKLTKNGFMVCWLHSTFPLVFGWDRLGNAYSNPISLQRSFKTLPVKYHRAPRAAWKKKKKKSQLFGGNTGWDIFWE